MFPSSVKTLSGHQTNDPIEVPGNQEVRDGVRYRVVSQYVCTACGGVLGHVLDLLPHNCPNCASPTASPKQTLFREPIQPGEIVGDDEVVEEAGEDLRGYSSTDLGTKMAMVAPFMMVLAVLAAPGILSNLFGMGGSPLLHLLSSWNYTGEGLSGSVGVFDPNANSPFNASQIPTAIYVVVAWLKTILMSISTYKIWDIFSS